MIQIFFIIGKYINDMCVKMNNALKEWLCCNKLSLNVLNVNYMIFTSRNKTINYIDMFICYTENYVTKFVAAVQIDGKLTWEKS